MQLLGGFCCYLIPRLTFLRPNTHASYLWGGGFNPAQSFAQPALAFLVKIRCLNDLIFIRGRTKVMLRNGVDARAGGTSRRGGVY